MPFNYIQIATILVAFAGLAFVFSGIHQIDAGWNLRYINTEFNSQLVDTTTIGNEVTAIDLYNQGIMEVMLGTFLIITGLMMFAYYEPRSEKPY